METDIGRMQLEAEARLGSQTMVEMRLELSSEPTGLECRVKYSLSYFVCSYQHTASATE